jgi:hypothetical protein
MSFRLVGMATALLCLAGCVESAPSADIDQAPLTDAGRVGLRRYFAIDRRPKVCAIAPKTGAIWYAWSYPTLEQTRDVALRKCEAFGSPCEVYAINDTVVWRKN